MPATVTVTFGERALTALPEVLRLALRGVLQQIDHLGAEILAYQQCIEEKVARHLVSVPGVGTLTAATFVLTLGRKERFAHSRDVGSYLGLRPQQKQSGERNPQLGISKSGDKYLRRLLVQCAHHILGTWGKDSALRQWGLTKCGTNKKRAVIAVARKLAVLLHRLWVTKSDFQPFPKMA